MVSRRTFVSALVSSALSADDPPGRPRFPAISDAPCPKSGTRSAVLPTAGQIENIIQDYIPASTPDVGVAVGMASPAFGTHIVCIGSLVDSSGDPMAFTTDTSFEVASITKTFVATIFELLFLGGGRADRTNTLGGFLGSQIDPRIAATPLRDLADYTSGLPADNVTANGTLPPYIPGDYTEAELLNFLAHPTFPIAPPGTEYSYSNLAFSLLAFALQSVVQGDGFGTMISNEILMPLGMTKTQPYVSNLNQLLPRGFDGQGNIADPGWGPFPSYYGAGGLVSTPNDMMTWLQFNMGVIQIERFKRVLPVLQAPAAGGAAGLPANTVPGLGWFLSTINNGLGDTLTVVQKDGNLQGFSSQMAFLARTGCASSTGGIFVLTNRNAPQGSYATNIAYDLLFAMAGLEPPSDKSRYPHFSQVPVGAP
jgi:serine-type D-Ala-D-Ala carboxypeptidase/endopeptidase